MTDNSLKGSIDIFTFFYNNDCRKGHDTGCFQLVPLNLHAVGRTVVATRRPSVFVAAVSPMDAHGNVYLSFDVQATRECLEAADTVVFEINKYVPRVFGDTTISIEKADYIYEADIPLPYAPATPSSEVEKQIAQHVVSLIHDGDCIQLGIGGMPNAVGEALMDNRKLPFGYQMVQRQRKSRAAPSSKTPAQKELRRLCGGNPPQVHRESGPRYPEPPCVYPGAYPMPLASAGRFSTDERSASGIVRAVGAGTCG